MITPAEINSRYSLAEPYLQVLREQVRATLFAYCDKNEFALVSRIKSVDSLSEKIESGRFSSWSQIDDLVAFCVVVPTLAEEGSVIEFLSRTFNQARLTRRGQTKKSPQVFRFDSTRFVGTLATPPSTELREIDAIKFEVQVRTAFDHAWVVTTHALSYKAGVVDWKQQRLAAELKATTEKMDLLIEAFREASVKVQDSPWPEIDAKRKIYDFFLLATDTKRIPGEMAPRDWSRFVDNVYELGQRCYGRATEPTDIAGRVIDAVDAELKATGAGVPLSLSLWQVTFGSVLKKIDIPLNFHNYWPLITADLETFYPGVKAVQTRFEMA